MSSDLAVHWRLDPAVFHLNHGSFGAAPRPVLAEQQRLRDLLEWNPDAFIHSEYQPTLDKARESLADFIGADTEGLAFVDNATAGVNAVLRSLEATLPAGNEIVITNHTYNACRNAAQVTADRTGGRVVTADFPFPLASEDEVVRGVLDAVTERTKVLVIDAITSPTGLVLPVKRLAETLEPDVQILVDAAHAPGMIEFDVSDLGVSYVTANCHKWICAPKGAAFLWVREDRREPIYPAAIGHGYNGGWPSDGHHIHQQFDWTGTDDPTAWFSVPTALATMATMHPDGWPGVRAANHELCLQGRDLLLEVLDIDAPAPDEMIGSIASIPVPDPTAGTASIFDPLMLQLREAWNIEVPVFSWPRSPQRLLRISAQRYNSLDEYEHLANALVAELGL